MELFYLAWQVDACEPTPSHNIILHHVFFDISIVQIEKYYITKKLFMAKCIITLHVNNIIA
jgi:hypothetical protein